MVAIGRGKRPSKYLFLNPRGPIFVPSGGTCTGAPRSGRGRIASVEKHATPSVRRRSVPCLTSTHPFRIAVAMTKHRSHDEPYRPRAFGRRFTTSARTFARHSRCDERRCSRTADTRTLCAYFVGVVASDVGAHGAAACKWSAPDPECGEKIQPRLLAHSRIRRRRAERRENPGSLASVWPESRPACRGRCNRELELSRIGAMILAPPCWGLHADVFRRV